MSVLGWLTVAYAIVLVVALAVSLTAIAVQLQRTGKLLGEAREALKHARDHTEPLEGPLRALAEAAEAVAGELVPACERLLELDTRLEETTERTGYGGGGRAL